MVATTAVAELQHAGDDVVLTQLEYLHSIPSVLREHMEAEEKETSSVLAAST